MNLMKRQRDSVGMSIYSDHYEFYSSEKASERHHQKLLQQLNKALESKSSGVSNKDLCASTFNCRKIKA